MEFIKYIIALSVLNLSACVAQEGTEIMTNGEHKSQSAVSQILAENRARLSANESALQNVGRTACGNGFTLELFAPRDIRFEAALRQTTAAPQDAFFWVLRVPQDPTLTEVAVTVPNAWDKPEWFAERRVDDRWLPVRKPASNGSAHASLVDAPATFSLDDAMGDIVLPVPLAGPLSRAMVDPLPGDYRIHFAPFSSVIGTETCSLNAQFWEVTLR